jgi:beta-lactam-binding protein with PASTA domain
MPYRQIYNSSGGKRANNAKLWLCACRKSKNQMSFIKKTTSALGKLIMVVLLAAAFLAGLVSVVLLSLKGEEIKVPEIVGKNFAETEKELASLGLRIKKRADRYSEEAPNTILEQLPKSGDTVKTGQMILVVTSKTSSDGTEAPMKIQKNTEDKDDTEKIEELIDDKPKKTTNSNKTTTNKKKATTTRDVVSNSSTKSNTGSGNNNSSGEGSGNNNSSNSNKQTTPTNKSNPTGTPKPQVPKPNDGGSTRPRTTNP